MKTEPNKRTKKNIIYHLEKLNSRYGFEIVRLILNRYYTHHREKERMQKEIVEKERELAHLKKKLT